MSLESIRKAVADMLLPEVDFIISTDTSESEWWETNIISPGRIWGGEGGEHHINYLELKAIYLAITAYRNSWAGCKHIRIRSDNTNAIAYINNMGGLVLNSCDDFDKGIWCTGQKIWFSAVKDNN